MSFARVALRQFSRPATASLRRSVQLGAARRSMSASAPHQPKSDMPWIIASALGVVGSLALIYSPSSGKSHAEHHDDKHKERNDTTPAAEKEEASSKSVPEPASEPIDAEEAKSIEEGLDTDAPKSAKAAEESGSSPAPTSDDSSSDDGASKSTQEALNADAPKSAKAAEEGSSDDKSSTSSEKPSDAGDDDDFVNVSKEDVAESVTQSLNTDAPKTAKASEEKK